MVFRSRFTSPKQRAALDKLRAADWTQAVTLNAADGEKFADVPHEKFIEQMLERALPAVITRDPEITPEVLRAAGINFNTPTGKNDKNGIVFDEEHEGWMVFGHRNLGFMAHHDVDIPEAKLFRETYEEQLKKISRRGPPI